MTALWIHEIVDRFWSEARETPATFPRDLAGLVGWVLPVALVELPNLSIGGVNGWLIARSVDVRLTEPDRPLRACILVHEGNGLLFVDAADDADERRFSVGHEIAHYLVEYAEPRRLARARLGDGIVPVLDGRRVASWDERLGAVLGGVSLKTTLHLMERTPDGHLPGREVSVAERRADELAFELLAPSDAVRASLVRDATRREVEAVLRQTFGLPAAPARAYARHLAPASANGSLFRRLFSVS